MVKLVNTSFGYAIGERVNANDKDVMTLKNPMNMLVSVNNQTGAVSFKVIEFPWKPTVLTMPPNHVAFDVTDEDVLKLYKQAVTGITLIHSGEIQKPH